jgi:hypothetical protein
MYIHRPICQYCEAVLVAGSILYGCIYHSAEMFREPAQITRYFEGGYASHEESERESFGATPGEPRSVVANTPSDALYQVGMEYPFQTFPGSTRALWNVSIPVSTMP